MRNRTLLTHAAVMTTLLTLAVSSHGDVLQQSESRAQFGEKDFAYFFIEAEDFHDNAVVGEESWILSSHEDALAIIVNETDVDPDTGELVEPDPWAYASGDESITNVYHNSTVTNDVGAEHDVQYMLEFDTAGTYYLYIRHHSPVGPELNRNQNDSFYYPIEFGEAPLQNKANGDDYGLLESMEFPEDTARRGPWVWFAAREQVENSEQDPPIDQNPGTFLEYQVTSDMVGEPVALEFDHRETGTMLDAFLFIESNSGLPPTNGAGPDGNGFFGVGDLVDIEFGLSNLGTASGDPNDCNMDDAVDIEDTLCATADTLSDVLEAAGLTQGDADGNGAVEFADFLVLSGNFGQEGDYKQGNFDLMGGVEFADFLILSGNFGAAAGGVKTVPEPGAMLLWSGVLLLSLLRPSRIAAHRD